MTTPAPTRLVILPVAFLKMHSLIALADGKEVSAMLQTLPASPASSDLIVCDVHPILQTVTQTAVEYDNDSFASYFSEMIESRGIPHEDCGRVWWHHHPFDSCTPSTQDRTTFSECFGKMPWAVMFITSKKDPFCALRFNTGRFNIPEVTLPVTWALSSIETVPGFESWPSSVSPLIKFPPPSPTQPSATSHYSSAEYFVPDLGWVFIQNGKFFARRWGTSNGSPEPIDFDKLDESTFRALRSRFTSHFEPVHRKAINLSTLSSPLSSSDISILANHIINCGQKDVKRRAHLWKAILSLSQEDVLAIYEEALTENPFLQPFAHWLDPRVQKPSKYKPVDDGSIALVCDEPDHAA